MRYLPALLIGRLLRALVRMVRPGGGSALPGLVLSKIAPGVLKRALSAFPQGVYLVSGSAGKSTTTKMLVAILREHGLSVFTNPSTANINQGFYSTLIQLGSLTGRLPGEVAVLEVDEGHALTIAKLVKPKGVVILNVTEDQLDRFVDPSLVRDKLTDLAQEATDFVALNASDQNMLILAGSIQLQPTWFSIDHSLRGLSEIGLGYAPTYLDALDEPVTENLVVGMDGRKTIVSLGSERVEFNLPNRGVHFAIDAVAALTGAKKILKSRFDPTVAEKCLNQLPPVFARGELREVRGQLVEFNLVQNPPSFQLNLDYLPDDADCIFVGIGRDVHDPSWLWTVDTEKLDHVAMVAGYNAAEITLKLRAGGSIIDEVVYDLEEAIEKYFELPVPPVGYKTVIFSADVMRRMRRYLGLTNPEDVSRI